MSVNRCVKRERKLREYVQRTSHELIDNLKKNWLSQTEDKPTDENLPNNGEKIVEMTNPELDRPFVATALVYSILNNFC